MHFKGLNRADKKKLEADVISNEARLKLTRAIRKNCEGREGNLDLINRNRYINIANTVMGLPIFRLEPDDWGMFEPEVFGWHFGETELILRRPNTAQLIEILGDMLQQRMLDVGDVNEILADDNVSIRFETHGFDEDVSLRFLTIAEIEEEEEAAEHPNVLVLISRMDTAFEQKDYAGVLHASATIFETMAKLVFDNPNVENQTLASFFDGFRQRSELPGPVLDFILATYKRRNVEPLAGHGATKSPTVTAAEASTLVEMTKMCIRLERRLATQEIEATRANPKPGSAAEAPSPRTATSPRATRRTQKKPTHKKPKKR